MSDEPKPIAIGDEVRWTHISLRGSYTNLTLRKGTVTAIEGEYATVKPLNKRAKPVQVKVRQLQAERKETAITAIVETMLGRSKE